MRLNEIICNFAKRNNNLTLCSMGMAKRHRSLFGVFLSGILYFFSIGSNPIKEYRRYMSVRNDADRMADDWRNVGNDIRKAYEEYKSARA